MTDPHSAPAMPPAPSPAPTPTRMVSLDVLRGATMLAMVLVNNPGSWVWTFAPLRHAGWTGCTPTDLIFPLFLFVMGVSMALSLEKRRSGSATGAAPLLPLLRRSAILFGLGLLLNAFPYTDLDHARIPGVLQRIALCHLLVSLVVERCSWRTQAGIAAVVLIAYGVSLLGWSERFTLASDPVQLVMQNDPSVEFDPRRLLPNSASNPVQRLDEAVMSRAHLYQHSWTDPEGLLSTLPACVTTLLGCWTGMWFARGPKERTGAVTPEGLPAQCVKCAYPLASIVVRDGRAICPECGRPNTVADAAQPETPLLPLLGAAGALLAAGWVSSALLPWSKPLWTPSYVLWTGGVSLAALVACVQVVDRRRWRQAALPFEIAGRNAILLFVGSGLLSRILNLVQVGTGRDRMGVKDAAYRLLFVRLAGGDMTLGSLLFALANVLIWWLVLYLLWRRRWFLVV